MALEAGSFRNGQVGGFNVDRFMEVLGGEGPGMPKPVAGLGHIFPHPVGRGVAIIARGHMTVAGFVPSIILGLHDVAVDTGLGIVGKVRVPPSVKKGESPYPQGRTKEDREQDIPQQKM
jgi:hypothetical protein